MKQGKQLLSTLQHCTLWCFVFIALMANADKIDAQESAKLPDYISSATCENCHLEQAAAWKKSDHSWAWRDVSEDNVLGNFDNAKFEHQGIETSFLTDDGGYWIETMDAQQALQRYQIKYVIGVRPLQQYVIELEKGHLQVLDIAWDTEGNQWFMLFPEHENNIPGNALHWSGVYKNWNGRCAECHATNYQKNYSPGTRSFSSNWSEIGVTCQGCHGPGEAHVKWAERPGLFSVNQYADIKENGLFQQKQGYFSSLEMEICASCHSRRTAFSSSSPIPGSPFTDHYDLASLRQDLYHSDGQIKDEVYVIGSFLQSKMYKKGVTCSDCHNPHSGKVKIQGNGLCTQCHNGLDEKRFSGLLTKNYDDKSHHQHGELSAGSLCVSCHMPQTTYMQVDRRRDHKFAIPSPENSITLGAPNACNQCHTDRDESWAANALRNWYPDGNKKLDGDFARVFHESDSKGVQKSSYAELMKIALSKTQSTMVRISAMERLRNYQGTIDWKRLLRLLKNEDVLIRAATAKLFQSAPPSIRVQNVISLLDDDSKLVRLAAVRSFMNLPPNAIPKKYVQAIRSAMGEYQSSLLANADHPNTQMALAGLALSFQNTPASKAAIKEALALDPQLTDGWIMLAQINMAEKRPDLVNETMEKALDELSNSSEILHFFGNYLASQRQFDKAQGLYKKAISISDENRIIKSDYAAILSQMGKNDQAIEILNLLIEEEKNPRFMFLLSNAQLQSGDRDGARKTVLKLLSIDPSFPIPNDLIALFSER